MSISASGVAQNLQDGVESAARDWDRFWFSPIDPTTLCFMRLCAGCVILYVQFSYTFDLMSYVHPERAWLDERAYNAMRHTLPTYGPPSDWTGDREEIAKGQYTWSIYFHLRDERWIWATHFIILGCTLLFTLGLWTRLMSVLTWIGALSYIERSSNMMFGMDTMIAIAMLYMMIGPSGATLSLDRWITVWRARRLNPNAIVPLEPSIGANIAIRLFQIHFCFIYEASGVSKLLGAAWWNGTALWSCVANYSFAPMEAPPFKWFLRFLCNHRLLWELFMSASSIFTLALEIGFPFLVWTRRFRWVMICASIMLHTGIGIIMGLVGFSMLMMTMACAFVPPEVVGRQIDRLLSIRRRAIAVPVEDPQSGGLRSVGLAASGIKAT